ncbi:MAG: isoprenylcysteine carboxylmethyltransferase family protein [Burkholderiales bacterium]
MLEGYRRFASGRAHDLLMRLPIVTYTVWFLVIELRSMRRFIEARPYGAGFDWEFALASGARGSVILFLALLAVFHLVRARPTMKSRGLSPRVSALAGLTLANLVFLFPRAQDSGALHLASLVLVLGGNYFCLVALLKLGRSLSIMPEARRLVTDGPYRYVRHPLYLAEAIVLAGIFLQFRSPPVALIVIAVLGFQLLRMHYEEGVLRTAFPEYADYARRTARLIPGVY